MQEFKAKSNDVGKRTDVFVVEKFPQFTRSALKALFEKELVLVNGRPEQAGDKLKEGDSVSIDASSLMAEPEDISLPIIYEDDEVVVVNKPAGLLSHSKGALNIEPTFASFLKKKITDPKLSGNRAGIVHRLDRATSGVIIGAKNTEALSKLQKQFSQRKTKKIYHAYIEGVPKKTEAIIDAPIQRNPSRPQTFKVNINGKPAQTAYKVIKTTKNNGQEYSLLELKPVTGRTHQLRVHLSYIGHPIVGDPIYGQGDGPLILHASSLEITLPSSKRRVFEAPLPKSFQKFDNGK